MSNTESPLSPHVSVYRWPITMTLSILHRITGMAMSFGLLVFAGWLLVAVAGGSDYASFIALMSTSIGRLFLIGWSFAFFLHLANGVRHLFWDFGHGFEKQQADASAWFVLILAVISTAAFWVLL
jgi:succinate dehydrogenase / fumarate reductase, cytochrome b subunit